MRRAGKRVKAKGGAKPSVAKRSRSNESSRVRDLEKRLAEALKREVEALDQQTTTAELLQARNRTLAEAQEQQTATAEVLRVISRSRVDLPPVLRALVENATRLCSADGGMIRQRDGEVFRAVAECGMARELYEFDRQHPLPPGRGSLTGRVALERRTVQIPDVLTDPEYQNTKAQQLGGSRTLMGVPMLREGTLIGVFVLYKYRVEPFTDRQIGFVETFADQAVIAIENVRLFQELQSRNAELAESLEQQTATSEILQVISSSPTDLQPVMDVVAESAARFCGATSSAIERLDGESLRIAAAHGPSPTNLPVGAVYGANRRSVAGRAVRDRETIHVDDFQALPETEFPDTLERDRHAGFPTRTVLATPLLREGVPTGVIYMRRFEVQPFTEKQIALAKTFAAQAVIAIENVRLFTELQEKNRALTEAHAQVTESLDQQTATAEILRVIAGSQTDIQPVFEAIIGSAVRLCSASFGVVYSFD